MVPILPVCPPPGELQFLHSHVTIAYASLDIMFEKLKSTWKKFRLELKTYQLVLKDSRTPRLARFFLGMAVAYALSPIDFIPDFIPIIGHLDDMIIVPLLVVIAFKLTPKTIIEECRTKANGG